ncbi:deoxycytidylate deaminase-like isoform X1 [Tachysurus ichikawai]
MANNPNQAPQGQTHEQYDDEVYYMAVALLFSTRTPDPNTKVGACIVNEEKKIVGVGFNRMPNGCEDKLPWAHKAEDKLEEKYLYVCHAELNAIMNKTSVDVKGCTMYVTLFPCNECAKVGACIVNEEKKIVGVGFNRMPNGCEDKLPWAHKAEDKLEEKYLYVCHAELNAIMNKTSVDVKGCTMYVTLFPCNECAKVIIQSVDSNRIRHSDEEEEEVSSEVVEAPGR